MARQSRHLLIQGRAWNLWPPVPSLRLPTRAPCTPSHVNHFSAGARTLNAAALLGTAAWATRGVARVASPVSLITTARKKAEKEVRTNAPSFAPPISPRTCLMSVPTPNPTPPLTYLLPTQSWVGVVELWIPRPPLPLPRILLPTASCAAPCTGMPSKWVVCEPSRQDHT